MSKSREPPLQLIFFSGHWCPPSRVFTPKFAKFFININNARNKEEYDANMKAIADKQAVQSQKMLALFNTQKEDASFEPECDAGHKYEALTSVYEGRVEEFSCHECN